MKLLILLYISFFIVGTGAWGGGTVAIPLIQHQTVEVHHWLTDSEISRIIALSQMTPGPLAINAATYTGYKVSGMAGAVVCTVGVVTPAVIILAIIIFSFKKLKDKNTIGRFRQAIGPAVLGLIILAAYSIGKNVITDTRGVMIFLVSIPAFSYTRGKAAPVWILIIMGIITTVLPQHLP